MTILLFDSSRVDEAVLRSLLPGEVILVPYIPRNQDPPVFTVEVPFKDVDR